MLIHLASKASKLSAFSNRPAIDAPLFNFITEFICCFVLITGISLIKHRVGEESGNGLEAFLIGVYVFALIACLGGTNNP
jgi:glycerol uptake facilitator-like aquaporin